MSSQEELKFIREYIIDGEKKKIEEDKEQLKGQTSFFDFIGDDV